MPAHGCEKLNAATRNDLGMVTGAFRRWPVSQPGGIGLAKPSGVVKAE